MAWRVLRLRTQRVAADMLNNRSWTADDGSYSYNTAYYEVLYDALNLDGAYGMTEAQENCHEV
jgi:hypothetical protein